MFFWQIYPHRFYAGWVHCPVPPEPAWPTCPGAGPGSSVRTAPFAGGSILPKYDIMTNLDYRGHLNHENLFRTYFLESKFFWKLHKSQPNFFDYLIETFKWVLSLKHIFLLSSLITPPTSHSIYFLSFEKLICNFQGLFSPLLNLT